MGIGASAYSHYLFTGNHKHDMVSLICI